MAATAQPALCRLDGKSVLITGSTRGIGRGIADVGASLGVHVYITSRNSGEVETVVKELTEAGYHAAGSAADLVSETGAERVVAAAVEAFGSLDVLVHNVGIYPSASIRDMTLAEWNEVLDTNLTTTYSAVHASAPYLQDQRSGRIVVVSSITGVLVGFMNQTHYAASKAAMMGFVKAAALEFAPHGVTVNAVAPGSIESPGLLAMGLGYLADRNIPVGRLGKPEDIGWMTAYLASDPASFITGQTFVVDGGQTVPEILFGP